MKNILFIYFFVMLSIITYSFAQPGWNYYQCKDLLVNGTPNCIKPDNNNKIFLGLGGGMTQFNGTDWIKIYNNELDPTSDEDRFNVRIIKIIMGDVWAATNEGLIKFNGLERKHYNLSNTPKMINDRIRGITGDKYANIWFINLALGIFKLDHNADTIVNYSIPENTPLPFTEDVPMFFDDYDNLWYSCAGKFVKFSDSKIKIIDTTAIPELKTEAVSSIQVLSNGSIVVLLNHSLGIYKDNQGTFSYNKIDLPNNILNDDEEFLSVKEDSEGNIWVLSKISDQLLVYSKHFYKYDVNKVWTKYEFPQFEGTSSNIYSISDFAIDEGGKVWFTELSYGVFCFDSKVTSIKYLENKENTSKLSIYFNPVTNMITLSPNQIASKIEIFSGLGIKVIETEFKNNLDVSNLPDGIYFISVICNNYIETRKFIIIR